MTIAFVTARTSYDVREVSYDSVRNATGVVVVCFAYRSLEILMRGLSRPPITHDVGGTLSVR